MISKNINKQFIMSIYNSFKFKFLIIIVIIVALFDLCFAKSQGSQLTTGFIRDNQCTSFYYDEYNYYNDGWHLIDDNGDGIYEYYYFSLSGHMLKDTITHNDYYLNSDGKLVLNDTIYQVSFLDIANSDAAIFLNKKESVDELTKGFEIDYNQVFNEWYIKSKTDITSQLNVIASNLTAQKVNKVRDEISVRVKECKKIGVWYNERLYNAKKTELITKDIHKVLSRKLQKDMSECINRFREEMGNVIKSMGY